MTLTARDLRFRYHRNAPWVLEGASLSIEPGEVVGLFGPSGTGKSTLGRLLAGLLTPQSGSITLDGEPVRRGPRGACPVQIVLQHPELAMDPRWRVRDVLAETGAAPPEIAELDGALLGPHWLDRFPHEISGGELQRVNLARALLARPAFIVADEISASLDAITQARIWQQLDRVARAEGIGVLAISHDRPLLAEICGRILDWTALTSGTGSEDGGPHTQTRAAS